jgi:hypothetical protein
MKTLYCNIREADMERIARLNDLKTRGWENLEWQTEGEIWEIIDSNEVQKVDFGAVDTVLPRRPVSVNHKDIRKYIRRYIKIWNQEKC